MTATPSASISPPDLRRAPLADVRDLDLRSPARDLWADEAALWDRFVAVSAGLDDPAWRLPGAAPSDAGGPDWSLHDHVAHVADWQELAIDYVARAETTGTWPSDDDFEGGDFDRFNERRRDAWGALPPVEVRERLVAGHARLVEATRKLPLGTIRSDEAWGWVYMTLHGHQLDHLAILEPWADRLRERQARSDPFVTDPRPDTGDDAADAAAFWAAEDAVMTTFDQLVRPVPLDRWTAAALTPGWTLRDHVAHLADWFEEAAEAVGEHVPGGPWREGPIEGFDAWNAAALARTAGLGSDQVVERFDRTYARLRSVATALPWADLRSDDGWSWVYESLHGHVRAHLAMVGPWCARTHWPAPEEDR